MAAQRKSSIRKIDFRRRTVVILKSIEDGTIDPYEGYRSLYTLWCANNAALQELRPLFRMPGIEPDGTFSATEEFRSQVRELAREILPLLIE
jgi:hypothetical protein